MKKGIIVIIAIVAIILLLVAIGAGSYNGFVQSRETVRQAQGNVQTLLQRRNDLIPNLVQSVKGYVQHEEKVFKDIADARSKLAGSQTADEMVKNDAALSSALSRLLVIVENYPDLKADKQFTQLNDELAGTENRIAVGRKDYNDAVRVYNGKVQSFPGVVMAGMFGFRPMPYFEAAAGAENAPEVNFE